MSERDEQKVDLAVFQVAEHQLSIPVSHVREVVRAVAVSPLPGAPGNVMGIIDVRGNMIPVYHLRRRLGLPTRPLKLSDHMVIVEVDQRTMSMVVDHVTEIVAVEQQQIEQADGLDLVTGMVRLRTGLIAVTNLSTFLDYAETEQLDAALAAHGNGEAR